MAQADAVEMMVVRCLQLALPGPVVALMERTETKKRKDRIREIAFSWLASLITFKKEASWRALRNRSIPSSIYFSKLFLSK